MPSDDSTRIGFTGRQWKSKQELRRRLKALRQAVSVEERAATSGQIARELCDLVRWSDIHAMHIYTSVPAWSEVDTEGIISCVRAQYPQIEIACPGVSRQEPIPQRRFDLIVIPVLGFDNENYRLGLGAGFYDRFLVTQPQALKIGLAYRWALLPEGVPREPHDIPLDKIITD